MHHIAPIPWSQYTDRQRDALIGQLLGWHPRGTSTERGTWESPLWESPKGALCLRDGSDGLPHYCTCLDDAWTLVERLRHAILRTPPDDYESRMRYVQFASHIRTQPLVELSCAQFAESICLNFLDAWGIIIAD